jgi:SAM-dependent methyltransferase
MKLLEPDNNARLLDAGCGKGDLTAAAAKAIGTINIQGVEAVAEIADMAREKGIKVQLSDLNDPFPFDNEAFDVVLAIEIIEHLSNTDVFLKEIFRILRKGGYVVVSTPNLSSWPNVMYLIWGKQPAVASVSDEVVVNTWHGNSDRREMKEGPSHRRIFTPGALEALLVFHGFKIEKSIGTGFFPLPIRLARIFCLIDKNHTARITVKARKF